MPLPNTLNQPITFEPNLCGSECEPIVIGTLDICPGIPNPLFEGAPVTDWILSAGLTEASNDPLNVTGAQSVTHTLAQAGLNFTRGDYTVSWDIDNQDVGALSILFLVTGTVSGTIYNTGEIVDGVGTSTWSDTVTIPGVYNESWTFTIALRQQTGSAPPVILDSVLNSISFCPVGSTQSTFCFQLPLFTTSTEILGLTDSEIGFARTFTAAAGYDSNENNTGATCPGSPTATNFSFTPACTGALTADGDYFIEIELGDITIDYALDPNDDTSGQVVLISKDGVEESETEITEADANTDILYKTANGWNNGDNPELKVRAKEECDGTDLREKWDIRVDSYSFIPSFFEDTFSATSDTFYRLTFDIDKATTVTVKITDSLANVIFEAQEDGPSFNKIFDTGTLAAGSPDTLTIRWEITDLTEWPNTNFNDAVLSSVELYKMCKWDVTIETTDEVNVATLAETHATLSELDGDSYNRNIQYCVDVASAGEGCYQLRAVNNCDSNEYYISNCLKVCKASCNLNRLSWNHDNVKYMGTDRLDYVNYDYDSFIFVKIDFQDLTHEWEGVIYRDAAYFLQQPYSAISHTKVMQVWPLPEYARRAVALALTDTFIVDTIGYKKLDDDAIAPQFQAQDPAPVRILVQKVGDFIQSRTV